MNSVSQTNGSQFPGTSKDQNIDFYANKDGGEGDEQEHLNMAEEGEVRVFDDENYIISDKLFKFDFNDDAKINWRNISKVDMKSMMMGEQNANDIILQNIDSISQCKLDRERNCQDVPAEGRDALKVMQAGMQYLIFAQQQMVNKLNLLQSYTSKQTEQCTKLEKVYTKQRDKIRTYKKMNSKLNEQAIHFEIMINKKRPDLQSEMLKVGENGRYTLSRSDVRFREGDENTIVKEILTQKGVIQDGQKTVFDYFKDATRNQMDRGSDSFNNREIENQEPNISNNNNTTNNVRAMSDIMEMLSNIQQQVKDVKMRQDSSNFNQNENTYSGQQTISQQNTNQKTLLAQQQENVREETSQVMNMKQLITPKKQIDDNIQKVVEEKSIQSIVEKEDDNIQEDVEEESYEEDFEDASEKMDSIKKEKQNAESGRNQQRKASDSYSQNFDDFDMSAMSKSDQTNHQNQFQNKSNSPVTPKKSNIVQNDSSPQEIEQIMQQQQQIKQNEKSQKQRAEDRLKSPSRRVDPNKNHATPIQEVNSDDESGSFEQEVEDTSSNPTQSKNLIEEAMNLPVNKNNISSTSKSGTQDNVLDIKATTSPINDTDSGFVNEDFLRKLQSKQESKKEDESIDKQQKDEIVSEVEDEEYNDDFEELSQQSGTHNQGGATSSMSGLPPLASGKLTKSLGYQLSNDESSSAQISSQLQSQQLQQNQVVNKRAGALLPSDFNLNMADSQQTIDFDISDSKILGPPHHSQTSVSKKSSAIDNLMRRKLDELNDSEDLMESNDFQVSESNFSQSFRSKDYHYNKHGTGGSSSIISKNMQKQKQQKPKGEDFYQFESKKFSSHYNMNNSADEDDEF